jgi:hypothetical protein
MVQSLTGDEEATRTTAEALRLGQSIGVGDATMGELLTSYALAINEQHRPAEASALLEYAARLAERSGDSFGRGRALLNLCYVVAPWDLQAAVDAARSGVEHCRRVGAGHYLFTAVCNLADSLIWIGDWDGADAALADMQFPVNQDDGLFEDVSVAGSQLLLAALRGEPSAARAASALSSRIPQSKISAQAALFSVQALIAEAEGRFADALAACRRTHAVGARFGLQADFLGWSWPVAARAAHTLDDAEAAQEMLAMLDGAPNGQIQPLLRAERDIARARLAANDDPAHAAGLFADGIRGLRAFGSPYHLAHGLVDHANFLASTGHPAEAASALDEGYRIATTLGAQPLAARVARAARAADIPLTAIDGDGHRAALADDATGRHTFAATVSDSSSRPGASLFSGDANKTPVTAGTDAAGAAVTSLATGSSDRS